MSVSAVSVKKNKKSCSIPVIPLSIKRLNEVDLKKHKFDLRLMKTSSWFNSRGLANLGLPSILPCVVEMSFVSTDENIVEKIDGGRRMLIPKFPSRCGWYYDRHNRRFSELHWFPVPYMEALTDNEKAMILDKLSLLVDPLSNVPNERTMHYLMNYLSI